MAVAHELFTRLFISLLYVEASRPRMDDSLVSLFWSPRKHCRFHVRVLSQLSRTCRRCTAPSACREINVQLLPAYR